MSRRRVAALAAASVILIGALAACAPDGGTASPAPTASASPSSSAATTNAPTAPASPSPSSTDVAVAVPTDCRAILSGAVLAQLGQTPLNDPAFGPSGVQADGSLICIWGSPSADTTNLTTTVSALSRGPALDTLNKLASTEGFTCYTPDTGTRCEKTWRNATYDVTDGRTLYWRQGLLIDTRYSNLAPTGYTASIVERVFG